MMLTKLPEDPPPAPQLRLDVVGALRESVAVLRERRREHAASLVPLAVAFRNLGGLDLTTIAEGRPSRLDAPTVAPV